MDINISHFLFISAALFAIGFYAAIRRRNIILVLINCNVIGKRYRSAIYYYLTKALKQLLHQYRPQ